MSSSVYKVIELVGTSAKSWEDAAKNAVETAGKSCAGDVSFESAARPTNSPAVKRTLSYAAGFGQCAARGSRIGAHPRCCSILSTMCAFGTTPTIVSTCWPFLNKSMLGIERTAKRIAVF